MVKREFLIERQGKQFVLYTGLLAEAHEQGLKGIRTHLLQIPGDDNAQTAICFAEVTTEKGSFTGIGDASPENTARMLIPHIIRMAETRAKARALRDAVNVGVCSVEELGPDVDEPPDNHRPATKPVVNGSARPTPATVPTYRPTYGGGR